MARNYKASRVSISPMIQPTKRTEDNFKRLDKFEERNIEGQQLVVLEAATLMMRMLQRTGPDIDGFSYKNDLKAVFSIDSDGEITFSFIGEQVERVANPNDDEIGYLYSKGFLSPGAQKWFEILREYQPWPVSMYPMPTGSQEAVGLTVRKVSKAALSDAKRRIGASKAAIERRMSAAGFPVIIAEGDNDRFVQTDLAFAILQTEFGLGRKADSHWRPAIEALKGEMGVLPDKFKRYLVTGNKAIFDIDNSIIEVSNIEEFSSKLQDRLARSVGLNLDRL